MDGKRDFILLGICKLVRGRTSPKVASKDSGNWIEHGWAQEPAERFTLKHARAQLEILKNEMREGDPAPVPPEPEPSNNGDVDVLGLWREQEPGLQRVWQGDDPRSWKG